MITSETIMNATDTIMEVAMAFEKEGNNYMALHCNKSNIKELNGMWSLMNYSRLDNKDDMKAIISKLADITIENIERIESLMILGDC